MKTTRSPKGKLWTAESNRFRWNHSEPSELLDKAKGQLICQMAWMRKTERGSDPVDEDTSKLVKQFFADLEEAETTKTVEVKIEQPKDPNAPCHKCGSYCYGDCDIYE